VSAADFSDAKLSHCGFRVFLIVGRTQARVDGGIEKEKRAVDWGRVGGRLLAKADEPNLPEA
jgi:hypothetical protein